MAFTLALCAVACLSPGSDPGPLLLQSGEHAQTDDKSRKAPTKPGIETTSVADAHRSVLDFTVKDIQGDEVSLTKYRGKVVLIVNVASKCGLTPQYRDLVTLHDRYAENGLAILGFPANEFGRQEPGTNAEIKHFCTDSYGVEFDMFSKVVVKGEKQCELFEFLTSTERNPKFGGEIKWNFTKFLIDRNGDVIARFEPRVKPSEKEVTAAIEKALEGK